MYKNALFVAAAIVKIAQGKAFKIGIDLRFSYTGLSCVW